MGKPLILIVEDEPDNREIIRAVVEDIVGCKAELAVDGEEGLAKTRELHPTLVLLDLMMPRVDGFTVARQLRANAVTRDIPIVAITALARPKEREEAFAAGCDDFIDKPFDLDALAAKVSGILKERHVTCD